MEKQEMIFEATPQPGERRIKMTYDEFLAWDEHMHMEWVDGEAIIFMPPLKRHQRIAMFLGTLLELFTRFLKLGVVVPAPFEMKGLPGRPSREPDLLFVANENLERLTEARLNGPADLVIELVSEESVRRDRADKFYEYQELGVREYWAFDTRVGKEREDFWVLDENGHYQPVPVGKDGIYRSTIIPGFWFRVDWLWQDELPDALAILGTIIGPERMVEYFQRLAADSRINGAPNQDG